MCGIAGYSLDREQRLPAERLLAMCRAMAHRGPDDEGFSFISRGRIEHAIFDAQAGTRVQTQGPVHDYALGHRRFSIIDPTPEGHQPFWSDDGRIGLVFNGEIYNYIELRAEMEKHGARFRTASDTEVLLQAYVAWGTGAFQKLRGFWAVAIYDVHEHAVLLVRDTQGQAPLYYAEMPHGIAWASEIKALRRVALPQAFAPREQAIDDFVRHGWRDLDNRTFYAGVGTLPAGCFAWARGGRLETPVRYWQIPTTRLTEHQIGPAEAVQQFQETFRTAVSRRLRADVPVAFELSGGMDSSSIVATAVEQGYTVSTYTIKFSDERHNEEPFAHELKRRFGARIDYHVIEPPPDAFWTQANEYVAMMDEPFHSPNMLTNRSIWKLMASQGARVSLNGAGGDEELAGYDSDYGWPYVIHLLRHMPLRAVTELATYRERPYGLLAAHVARQRFLPRRKPMSALTLLRTHDRRSLAVRPPRRFEELLVALMGNWRMNYWLRSAHQSAMSVPMEVRAPFLDQDMVDLCFQLPATYLIRHGWQKWILRKAMNNLLPPAVAWRRKKMGFPFPLDAWLMASMGRVVQAVKHLDCPYLDHAKLTANYSSLAAGDAPTLWRAISVALWWRRCVRGDNL